MLIGFICYYPLDPENRNIEKLCFNLKENLPHLNYKDQS
jgi:hypothetical protein